VTREDGWRALPATMFLVSFAWGLVYVALPFHIEDVSTVDPAATLAWTGWILGITSLVTVASTPLWSRFAAGRDPRRACAAVQVVQGLGFLATALADSLGELFLARLGLGIAGSTSTFAFILASRIPDPGRMRRLVAAVQSAITVASLVSPLVGASVAARVGFPVTSVLGGVLLLGSGVLVRWGVPEPPPAPAVPVAGRAFPVRDVLIAAAIVLTISIHESFLAAVLPRILPDLGVGSSLEAGGVLLFASGGLAAPRLLELTSERRLLPALLVGSAAGLLGLGLPRSIGLYTVVRFAQALCVAPIFPLLVARIAQLGSGQAISLVNAARIGANFLGPVVATSILAWSSPGVLYVALALGGLGCVPLARAPLTPRRRA
jgi:MFS family permease